MRPQRTNKALQEVAGDEEPDVETLAYEGTCRMDKVAFADGLSDSGLNGWLRSRPGRAEQVAQRKLMTLKAPVTSSRDPGCSVANLSTNNSTSTATITMPVMLVLA